MLFCRISASRPDRYLVLALTRRPNMRYTAKRARGQYCYDAQSDERGRQSDFGTTPSAQCDRRTQAATTPDSAANRAGYAVRHKRPWRDTDQCRQCLTTTGQLCARLTAVAAIGTFVYRTGLSLIGAV